MENQRKPNVAKKISVEIGMEFLNVIFGNVYTRTGLSLILFIVSLTLFFAPMGNEIQKPKWFYIVGGLLILISGILIFKRYIELKRHKKNK